MEQQTEKKRNGRKHTGDTSNRYKNGTPVPYEKKKGNDTDQSGTARAFIKQKSNGDQKKEYANKSAKTSVSVSREKKGTEVCPYVKKCGACVHINLPYEKQLAEKQKQVKSLMGTYCKVHPIAGMEQPLHYRHKVHAVFGCDAKGRPAYGIYQPGTHTILPIHDCPIENSQASAIIDTIGGMLRSFKIRTYNEDTGYGLLRHVVVRTGYATGQIMVILVMTSHVFPSKNNFIKVLREKHPEINTIVLNVNDKSTTMVLGSKDIVLYGKGYIEDELDGQRFRISPQSFYQINPPQAEKLYRLAIQAAGLTGKERVLDAYCGTGTIGISASRYAREVWGVELNRDAVKDAIQNAKMNGCKNTRFYNADAGLFMEEVAESQEKVDVVIMDPPRSGSDEVFLGSLVKLRPEKVVYVSCNPETLARDVKWLTEHGYEAKEVWPVDMFGGTVHVETVCLLSKLNTKQHIEVELNMDELDLTSAESKATYEEIKEYVLEHTGLKVSHLYIAQVKRKHGIIERANYNLPKNEDAKQPSCPPEKEKAITEALKFFGMI